MQRKLTAIMAADVVGYSRLMEVDETDTLARLQANRREIVMPRIASHGGHVVKLMGDGSLSLSSGASSRPRPAPSRFKVR